MNAVTSPLTWSFLIPQGFGTDYLPVVSTARPMAKPQAFDPALCSEIVTGTEGTEALSASEETAQAWFFDKKSSATRDGICAKPPFSKTAALAFHAALLSMTYRADSAAQS
jgi:hypothetical protein